MLGLRFADKGKLVVGVVDKPEVAVKWFDGFEDAIGYFEVTAFGDPGNFINDGGRIFNVFE